MAKRVPDGHGRSFGSCPWQKPFIVLIKCSIYLGYLQDGQAKAKKLGIQVASSKLFRPTLNYSGPQCCEMLYSRASFSVVKCCAVPNSAVKCSTQCYSDTLCSYIL